jgi:hypothetical protein
MLLALLAPKDLFPVCCLLCLLLKTYFQYAVGFAQHTGNKSLGASKVNSILELSLWEQANPKTYLQYAVGFACSQRLISSMLFTLLAPKDLFPVCCWLCLLPETYF